MSDGNAVVVVGGTGGIGRAVAQHYADAGRRVYLSGRELGRAAAIAAEVGGDSHGLAIELTAPDRIATALAEVGPVDRVVLSGIDRGGNSATDFQLVDAIALVTQKLVGYIEVVHALRDRLAPGASVVIYGGQARVRPYPGSTMVSTVNGGVSGMVRTLSVELAPVRVNALHPGIVGDSPFWADKPQQVLDTFTAGTLTGTLATMSDVVDATVTLLENASINGAELVVDSGWR